jgi:hypothetical protein
MSLKGDTMSGAWPTKQHEWPHTQKPTTRSGTTSFPLGIPRPYGGYALGRYRAASVVADELSGDTRPALTPRSDEYGQDGGRPVRPDGWLPPK